MANFAGTCTSDNKGLLLLLLVPPVTTETVVQIVQALLRAQQDQEKN